MGSYCYFCGSQDLCDFGIEKHEDSIVCKKCGAIFNIYSDIEMEQVQEDMKEQGWNCTGDCKNCKEDFF